MSKCFKKLINIYRMCDCYRQLYPHSKQFSRYYIWKGKEGATRIDRCYAWGNVRVTQAEYLAVSFSDHLAHIVKFDTPAIQCREKSIWKSIYKIKHFLVDDEIFRENIRTNFQDWLTIEDVLSPTFWWDKVVKPGIKDIALLREKEINMHRRRKLAALQLLLSYHFIYLKKCSPEKFIECISKLDTVKAEMQMFYQERAKII